MQVGATEIDLSDVFANNHEEVSAPLFTRVSVLAPDFAKTYHTGLTHTKAA